MKQHSSRLARFPIYFWIAGVYPILHLYAVNFGLVHDHQVAQTIAAMLIATSLGYLITQVVNPNSHKNAFFLTLASLYFSTSGHIYSLFVVPRSLLVWSIASAIVMLAIAIACLRYIPLRRYVHFTPTLNLIAAALLTMQLISLFSAHLAAQQYNDSNTLYSEARDDRSVAEKVLDSPERPDIYYIIPDGYPSDEQLLTEMNFDNSEFTQALKDRGFVIVPHAQSNYGTTLNALATTLNMRYYVRNLSGFADLDHLRNEIASSEVAYLLLERGYTFLQLNSGFLLPSPIADENLEFGVNGTISVLPTENQLSPQRVMWGRDNESQVLKMLEIDGNLQMPFSPLYFKTSLLRIALPLLEDLRLASSNTPLDLYSPQRFLATLDELERIAQRPEATFTIAHLIKPHGPLSFDASGNVIEQTWFPAPHAFEKELTFVNQMFLETLDSILASSDGQALIIFQADHGTIHGRNSPKHNRMTLFDIYAAYFFPEGLDIEVPQPYTTVNSFAVILNEVFDTELTIRQDRLFEVPRGYDAPFEQVDVTEEFLQSVAFSQSDWAGLQ